MVLLALGKALLPGEQGLRETEVVGPDLAGYRPDKIGRGVDPN